MATTKASVKRLTKEYRAIKLNPPPYIIAKPLETNILEWHYVLTGPPDTPYEGGQYHGKLVFPDEYPFKPPSIKMTTPNGRFKTDTRLCLSISDFHPDTWNPAWSVSTILNGLLSFMVTNDSTSGSIITTEADRKNLALKSHDFNFKNKKFRDVFPDLVKQYEEELANKVNNPTLTTEVKVRELPESLPAGMASVWPRLIFALIIVGIIAILQAPINSIQ